MAEGKEFPDDFAPTPTPLSGLERLLVEKGVVTLAALKAWIGRAEDWAKHPASEAVKMGGHRVTALGAPIADADAASKKYVDDAIAGQPNWSTVPATANPDISGRRVTNMGAPMISSDAATKQYVDGIAGIAASIYEGAFALTADPANENNITASGATIRYIRVGRTAMLTGTYTLTADQNGHATAAFTGIPAVALPASNTTYRALAVDRNSTALKQMNVMVNADGSFRFLIMNAEAGREYRISTEVGYLTVV